VTEPTHAAPFAEMAKRIEHNAAADFAGAIVIVPPTGEAMSVLMLDGGHDRGAFWSMARARIEIVWKQLQDEERRGQLGGGMMR
jgi:hypothetical protein